MGARIVLITHVEVTVRTLGKLKVVGLGADGQAQTQAQGTISIPVNCPTNAAMGQSNLVEGSWHIRWNMLQIVSMPRSGFLNSYLLIFSFIRFLGDRSILCPSRYYFQASLFYMPG